MAFAYQDSLLTKALEAEEEGHGPLARRSRAGLLPEEFVEDPLVLLDL